MAFPPVGNNSAGTLVGASPTSCPSPSWAMTRAMICNDSTRRKLQVPRVVYQHSRHPGGRRDLSERFRPAGM